MDEMLIDLNLSFTHQIRLCEVKQGYNVPLISRSGHQWHFKAKSRKSTSVHAGIADPPPQDHHPQHTSPGAYPLPVQCMLGDTANKRVVRVLLEYLSKNIFRLK